ncbi:MAG: ATP phosphoribosyltransferase regulatory subunit, partial [Bacteroidia bacterium]|nr:ATP phosphoribosyltransferase regulatory subunit [Bacteroidia bacterium]
MAQKPSIPKGTRDYSPKEMVRRNYIFDSIKEVFQSYGYLPIETPAMENLSTLLGKYGDESDRLIFRILNSGNFFHGADLSDISQELCLSPIDKLSEEERKKINQISSVISEKALRFDLTVPFARYIVQHQNEITFPFKRYQIQPVWRADNPQKGRYREFYQCDVDVIGSNSLLNEFELIQITDNIFHLLEIPVTIKFNNR